MKKRLSTLTLVLLAAVTAQAYTVTQNFNSDPWTNGWSKTETASTMFMYNTTNNVSGTAGYIDSTVSRSTSAMGITYLPLGQTYYMPNGQNGSANANHLYIGFDLQFGSGAYSTQQVSIGLLNSAQTFSNSATQNSLGLDLCKAAGGMRTRSETINGTGGYVGTSTNTTYATIADQATRRYQVHYYMSGGKVYADIKVGTFDVATGAFTANVFTQNNIQLYDSAVSWDTVGMNALGIKNLYMSTGTSKAVKFVIDNMYFSTDSEQFMDVPAWVVPEPATIAILAFGSLLFRRKK
jgi:hypothetical protein